MTTATPTGHARAWLQTLSLYCTRAASGAGRRTRGRLGAPRTAARPRPAPQQRRPRIQAHHGQRIARSPPRARAEQNLLWCGRLGREAAATPRNAQVQHTVALPNALAPFGRRVARLAKRPRVVDASLQRL